MTRQQTSSKQRQQQQDELLQQMLNNKDLLLDVSFGEQLIDKDVLPVCHKNPPNTDDFKHEI